ncbi:OsmC/Ohr family [Trichoderma velutinum]
MKATGLSTWMGSWREGAGTISTTTATFKEAPFSFSSRFQGTPGGSPEELLAVALAGCFNQALANNFGMIGLEADTIETSVTIELGFGLDKFPDIFNISIVCKAWVIGLSKEDFEGCAERARTRCTIARLLKIDPHMTATLVI